MSIDWSLLRHLTAALITFEWFLCTFATWHFYRSLVFFCFFLETTRNAYSKIIAHRGKIFRHKTKPNERRRYNVKTQKFRVVVGFWIHNLFAHISCICLTIRRSHFQPNKWYNIDKYETKSIDKLATTLPVPTIATNITKKAWSFLKLNYYK